ncbi:hypothetical protein FC093_07845 [Ilyomonas limi]|uniref:Asl1-like glycosyl hydrolase catalytic domain-containing protein n=1 Tax=Ilyomonas limi TaxID=2575867 RepID=A0A4U3L2S7_9BACT|nr:hypothetical protein [Ilyomonas limi]TKK69220.1 hypothetical protein FC093_07845 [Ilyomonas limi]
MKNYYLLAVAFTALLFCSCQKEELKGRFPDNLGRDKESSSLPRDQAQLSKTRSVQYGALINAPSKKGSLDFQVNVANQLGISCLRSRVIVSDPGEVAILNSGYKVLLNFNSDYEGTPLPFVSNLAQYQTDLQQIISNFSALPVVAAIENEESNRMYHSGTAQEYINQLSVAIDVMHANGIKVTNGGITDAGLNYLVYQDFMNQGKYDSAEQFKKLVHVTPKNPNTQNRGRYVDTLLQAYAQMELDYVNFHWKAGSADMQALTEVIAYLKKRTGKPIISNELGQFDKDPNTLTALIQKCTDEDFPYIIWYSPDENAGKKDAPLQYSDASLTPSGIAYQRYPKH